MWLMDNMIKTFNAIAFDAAKSGQYLFQCPATNIMNNIVDLHHDIMALMLILAVIVFYLIGLIFVKFRAGAKETKRRFEFTHHTAIEMIWTVIPIIILLLILVPSFVLLYSMDEIQDSLITLKVIGRQWYWTYEYSLNKSSKSVKTIAIDAYLIPEADLTVGNFRLLEVDNRIKIPAEVCTRVLVTATDVLHSWAVPSFGVKMDACPGRLNALGLCINRISTYYGQCSEICGINHGFMPIVVESVSVKNYLTW